MTEILDEELDDFLQGHAGNINTEKPAKILKVNSQYYVDVEYDENGQKDILYNVPVKHLQTNRAFVFLKLKEGDKGTIRFFDNDVDLYRTSGEEISTEVRVHDLNDNYYDFGFYPDKEQYLMPDCEICIGLKDQRALIEITEQGNILLSAQELTLSGATSISLSSTKITANASTVIIGEDTTIDGKKFLEHRHSNGNQGNPTGGVI